MTATEQAQAIAVGDEVYEVGRLAYLRPLPGIVRGITPHGDYEVRFPGRRSVIILDRACVMRAREARGLAEARKHFVLVSEEECRWVGAGPCWSHGSAETQVAVVFDVTNGAADHFSAYIIPTAALLERDRVLTAATHGAKLREGQARGLLSDGGLGATAWKTFLDRLAYRR